MLTLPTHSALRLSNGRSGERELGAGVAQGAILSPTLFSIYTAPLYNVFKHSRAHFYADDIQVYMSVKPADLVSALVLLNGDLNNVARVAEGHSLILNARKSKVMVFGGKRDVERCREFVNVVIDDIPVPLVEEARDLGLLMESNLKFRRHVSQTLQASYAKLKTIFPLRHLLDVKTKTTLCDTLILSKFNYGDVIYNSCILRVDEGRIQRVQNSCLRYIFGIRKFDRISYKLREVGWLNMRARRVFHFGCFMYKIIAAREPEYLASRIEFRTDVRHLNLRFRGLTLPVHRTEHFKSCFTYQMANLYNRLPDQLKSLKYPSFRKKLKEALFDGGL